VYLYLIGHPTNVVDNYADIYQKEYGQPMERMMRFMNCDERNFESNLGREATAQRTNGAVLSMTT
jgi:hypothetical protein